MGSFGLQQFTQLRYTYQKSKTVSSVVPTYPCVSLMSVCNYFNLVLQSLDDSTIDPQQIHKITRF